MSRARFAILAAVLIAATQTSALDHFKFWRVQTTQNPAVTVQLKGQFDKAPWKAVVGPATFIGNPVDKNKEGIKNPLLHYVAYAIKADAQPVRHVIIQNQFTKSQDWRLGQPSWLLAPADKKIDAKPGAVPKGDHFACYAALDMAAEAHNVTLLDQFDKTNPEKLTKLQPAFFCVPVQKTHDPMPPTPIIDEKTHLAVYRIDPMRTISRPISTRDQFGVGALTAVRSEFLGVPSLKLKVVQP